MAYSSSFTIACLVSDALGGQQTLSLGVSTIVPTKPAFCGGGTATTTPTAISYGSVTTPKALIFINDGAQDVTVDVGTDTHVVKASGSTTGLSFLALPTLASAPLVSTGSSTSAYRTLILE